MENEVTAKFSRIGWSEGFYAFRGTKVLCDRMIRVRRFHSQEAALKAGQKADPKNFH